MFFLLPSSIPFILSRSRSIMLPILSFISLCICIRPVKRREEEKQASKHRSIFSSFVYKKKKKRKIPPRHPLIHLQKRQTPHHKPHHQSRCIHPRIIRLHWRTWCNRSYACRRYTTYTNARLNEIASRLAPNGQSAGLDVS